MVRTLLYLCCSSPSEDVFYSCITDNAAKSELTKDLQALNKTHISTITEKERLKTDLKKKSEELSALSNKSKA